MDQNKDVPDTYKENQKEYYKIIDNQRDEELKNNKINGRGNNNNGNNDNNDSIDFHEINDQQLGIPCIKNRIQTFGDQIITNDDYRVYDNLKENDIPVAEVLFKGNRKMAFRNDKRLQLKGSELVIVETENGIDAGRVSNCCVSTISKMKKLRDEEDESEKHIRLPKFKILRSAKSEDIEQHIHNTEEESEVVKKAKEFVDRLGLDMKVTEAEWQFDRMRLTIFFTAPQRIDFRELVKELARTFKTRIELRQISSREETKRLGCGSGACGLTLCCTSFLREFSHVTLEHAKLQQLSNNVAKLSGSCGRLKCCLLFEYDNYVEAFKKFPPPDSIITTKEGRLKILKVDIFKEIVYLYNDKKSAYSSMTLQEVEAYKKKGKIVYPSNGNGNGNGTQKPINGKNGYHHNGNGKHKPKEVSIKDIPEN